MAANLELQDAGVPAAATDFGLVRPGENSTNVERQLANTGDADFVDVRLWVEQSDPTDGEYRVLVAGTPLTDAPQSFGPLAVGALLSVEESWSTPPGAPGRYQDSGTLRWEADY